MSGIRQRVMRAALFAVIYCNHSGRMIDHPLISLLKAGWTIGRANEADQISGRKNALILYPPWGVPAGFKTPVRTGADQADQPDGKACFPELDDQFRRPKIHAAGHTGNKDGEPIGKRGLDAPGESGFDD